ncbi:hypothetical protein [Cellulomonas sp. GbtcB1]|uniref:hypothetical protein n=1 Tax=Cellulomonas sp. GbtcB1 TaxID=2824746 RepID=UPI001C2FC7F4|nr:hypothetical protein [Cellulomonas sp. GbtcB1]
MGTTDNRQSAGRPGAARAMLWWADTYLICALCFTAATWTLLDGQPIGLTLALYAVVVVCGTYALRSRLEFRRGWRHGYESAVRTMLEYQSGRTPDVEVRAAVQGDPTPEPWDVHLPVVQPQSLS